MGPISARFTGRVTLSNLNPPISYTIEGEGVGGVAGFAKGGVDVSLAEVGQETLLPYTVKADVGGKVEQFGARLINATAKESGWPILRPILRTDCKDFARLTVPSYSATPRHIAEYLLERFGRELRRRA